MLPSAEADSSMSAEPGLFPPSGSSAVTALVCAPLSLAYTCAYASQHTHSGSFRCRFCHLGTVLSA
jgi:hypothetical protein